MANAFYNRGASFNPDELADGDAIEAEFDSVSRGFDTIEDLVNLNKAGYPSQTFHVAPATETTHAVQKTQLDQGLLAKQPIDALLTSIAGLITSADKIAYFTGVDSVAMAPLTPFARSLLDDADSATMLNTLGALSTAIEINGVGFDGSAPITVEPYVEQDTGANATRYLTFVDLSTAGYQRLNTDTALTYNPSTNVMSIVVSSDVAEVGKVSAFARSSAPSGYLKCNGAAISRTTYSALFAAIGTTFGLGDGSTTFNIPDLRGEFIRGWDDARGVDTSREFGSWQDNQNASHTHTATVSSDAHTHTWSGTTSSNSHSHTYTKNSSTFTSQSSGSTYFSTWYGSATGTTSADTHAHTVSGTTSSDYHNHTVTNEASGGAEVRVRNRALLYCIKY